MQSILRWGVGVIAVVITVKILAFLGLPLTWPNTWGIIIFVPVLAVVNAIIGSILRLFALPITCITFGLFGFVINAIVFWIAGWATGANMTFISALVGSILYTVISAPLGWMIKENRRRE